MRTSSVSRTDGQRRFAEHYPARGAVATKAKSALAGHTIFPSRVVDPSDTARVLVSGANNSKLGKMVTVGRWKGDPLFQLTLEERATCDSACHLWLKCYGNSLHMARRHKHGPDLETALHSELRTFQILYPRGFVIRLHVLGDFYSVAYVDCWRAWLTKFPALNVFGFTARPRDGEIGKALLALVRDFPERFAMRWSMAASDFNATMTRRAITLEPGADVPHGAFACPAQSKNEKCCANCSACWQSQKTVAFYEHGPVRRGPARLPA